MGEHGVHESLVGDIKILEAKERDNKAVAAMIRHERHLGCVQAIYFNLDVPRVGIHKAQHTIARGPVNQAINIRQGI